jgi:hypothetical protein
LSGQALPKKQCACVAHECSQGSAPNPGIDLCFCLRGQSNQQRHSDKKLCAGCFDSHQNSLHKVCPKPIADTSSRSHRTLHATCCPCHCQGRRPPQASPFSRPAGGIINKARGMGSSAPGATDCPRGSQQRAGAAPGAPHEPIIYAPAHTADKASHRIPDGPDTSFHKPPRRHGFAQHSREHGHTKTCARCQWASRRFQRMYTTQ